jgi:hypothetical protein
MTNNPRIGLARRQVEFARHYTQSLLDELEDGLWFTRPTGCTTHVAWQVGHLAMAEYGLCLFRIRGRQPEDTELMSSSFRKKFSRGSTPDPDPSNNPTADEIRAVFNRVHQQTLAEIVTYNDEVLDEPVEAPYAAFATKYGALLFCSHHEMIHAGQIGLLRRLLGKEPVR